MSVCVVSVGVSTCVCPRRQCVCVSVPGCLPDTEREHERLSVRAREEAAERICQRFLINPCGTRQTPVLISHREFCWFGGKLV